MITEQIQEKDLQFIRSLMATPLGYLLERSNQVFWICSADLSETLYVSPAYEGIWGRPTHNLYSRPESFTDPPVYNALAYLVDESDRFWLNPKILVVLP